MESLKFHLGTMKNMQGTLMNVGNEPYSETIFPSDKRFCATEAYERQLALLPQKGNVPLFRRIKFHQIQLGLEHGTTESCQGAADWASKVLKRKLVFKDLARRAAMTKAANSGLPLPGTSKYLKVRPKTMMVYHQASRDTAHKVAGILSGHAPASKPAAPGLLDEDFPLESTSLGIPENNAEVVAAVVASPAQDVPHVPEQVAPIAPVDVPHVPEQVAPIAPLADLSPGKVSVTSSQSACSVDLLADCKSAFKGCFAGQWGPTPDTWVVVGWTTRFFTKKKRAVPRRWPDNPFFYQKKKRAVKPFLKKNGLLTRFADYSPFFLVKKRVNSPFSL